jgi:hypothetical protein
MAKPMRRLAALLPVLVLLALSTPSASAQTPSPFPSPAGGDVRLRLLEQTLWNGPERPMLELRFRASNEGATQLGRLTIGVVLFGRVLSRSAYEASLLADPIPAVVVEAETYAREGPLEPGASRVFELAIPIDAPGIDATSSGVYPLKVDLRVDGTPVAAIRTPVVYLVREPEQPLTLSWTFVLDHPIAFRPDGVFTSTALEDELAPSGRITGLTRALADLARTSPAPVDVAVSPALLLQLQRMRDGYALDEGGEVRQIRPEEGGAAAASTALEALRIAVSSPQVALSALPYSAPQIPSLISGGLARDLDVQLARGRELVGSVLQVTPDPTVLRPPGGALDETTLGALAARGIRILALDDGTVETPLQPLGFAPPPVTSLREEGDLVGLVPDPSVANLLASPLVAADPVLGAHAVLGELASIWQEQPGLARGLAMVFPESLDLPGSFYPAFIHAAAGAPWLRPVSARDLVATFPPGNPDALAAPSPASFTGTYVAELKQARRQIDVYRSMLVDPSDVPESLDTQLLLAESGGFLQDPTSGFAFVTAAADRVSGVFGAITIDAGDVVTLTSRSGSNLPVRVASEAAERLRVTITLESSHLARAATDDVVLEPGEAQTLTFDVDLKTTGRFQVDVLVEAPGGRVIAQSSVTVRSTAYNRIALFITIAAAVVLLLAWGRRFLPRRTT